MRVSFTLFLLLFIHVYSISQSNIAFIAHSDADGVIPSQPFEVTFELQNTQVKSFDAPEFGPLNKLGGPAITNSIQVVNGRKSISRTYTYTLSAPNAGLYMISPASAETENGILRSNSLEIEIKPMPEGKTIQAEGVILEIVPHDTQVYVGEQLILDYVLYFKEPVERIYTANKIDFSGFYKESINQFPRSVQRTSLNGIPYSKKIIQRDVLFGQQAGDYTFGPLFLEVEIAEGDGRSPFSFFRNTVRKEVNSAPISVHVKPLPDNPPPAFSGGVGAYTMEVQAQQRQVKMGEAVEILVNIEGNGDPNILDAPNLKVSNEARVFDPQLVHEAQNAMQGQLRFSRSWNYLVVPEEEGDLTIQPVFVYLNADEVKYDTLESKPIDVWVNPTEFTDEPEDDPATEGKLSSSNSSLWIYLLAALLIILFSAGLFFRFGKSPSGSRKVNRKAEFLISMIEKEKDRENPNLSSIKSKLQDLLDNPQIKADRLANLKNLTRSLERFQFSQEQDDQKIRLLLDEIISELRKAKSELE